jgi:aminomethyltransferase
MPIPSPFHSRTAKLCTTQEWRDWSGYLIPITFGPSHEHEYYAVRNAAGLLDVSPLFKYEIEGPDALRLVNRIMTRDISKCNVGQVMYSPWCDDDGKVIDDGTVSRLKEDHFRITAADPSLRWFQDAGDGMDAQIRDVSRELAALALQGPNARAILKGVAEEPGLDALKYYWLTEAKIGRIPATITRTGYTGDLGYELWINPNQAERLWDRLMEAGEGYGIAPLGLAALDILRIEAGLLLIEVDYISAQKAVIESQKSSPYEIGLGWTVALDKPEFIGQTALREENVRGAKWSFVGLEAKWDELENLFTEKDLAPQVAGRASRASVPIYKQGRQVGQATSVTFSPILKKYIALATIESSYAAFGSLVDLEITVEYERRRVPAKVRKLPFYNPKHKRESIHGE